MEKDRKTAYIALFVTAIVWGVAPPIIKYTLQFTDPVTFLFYRFELASVIIFVPLIIKLNRIKLTEKESLATLGLGLLGTPIALLFLFFGLTLTSSLEGSLIWVLSPIFIVLGGVFFLKEKLLEKEKIGIGITLIGLFFTIIQPLLQTNGLLFTNLEGNLLVFIGTLCWSGYSLLVKKINSKRVTPFILTSTSFILAALCLLPFVTTHTNGLDLRAVPGIIYMGIFGSLVAYLGYTYGFSKIEASEASVFTYLQPIFAVPIAIILLGEEITLPFIFGAILIAIGVFITESKPQKVLKLAGN
jgi:drug/metabolite transporter (DMT)-like permease